MNVRKSMLLIAVFAAGITVGAVAKKGVDPAMYEAYRRAQQGGGRRQWGSGGVTVEDFDMSDLGGAGEAPADGRSGR